MTEQFIVSSKEAGDRLDKFLVNKMPELSRSFFCRLIETDQVLVNKSVSKPSYNVQFGDSIEISFKETEEKGIGPEKIPLNIIFENRDVIVLNKQPGMVVHPAAGHMDGTLVNALLSYYPDIEKAIYDKSNPVSILRPGLVHRLDKDTSGVIIIAKNLRAMKSLSKQIKNRTIKKVYWGLCYGWFKNKSGQIVSYLGRHPKNRKLIANIGQEKGKEAITDYEIIQKYDFHGAKLSLVEFDIKTGRTHQIRVQTSDMHHPILGDDFYGNKLSKDLSNKLSIIRQMLHAKQLEVFLPGDSKKSCFEAPLASDFESILSLINQFKE